MAASFLTKLAAGLTPDEMDIVSAMLELGIITAVTEAVDGIMPLLAGGIYLSIITRHLTAETESLRDEYADPRVVRGLEQLLAKVTELANSTSPVAPPAEPSLIITR